VSDAIAKRSSVTDATDENRHARHVHAADTGAPYLTPCQLAGIVQTSDATVYRWTVDPTMPVLRVGGVVRFPRDRVLAWLRSREQGIGRPKVRQLEARG
jgi:excisionase family DNA binding protein